MIKIEPSDRCASDLRALLILQLCTNTSVFLDVFCVSDYLKERGINCYIQYTLNDYDNERLEKGVPKVADRIQTFQKLVSILGKGRVIWRFDPLLLTDTIDITLLLKKIEGIAEQLVGYTEKLVFSFADILAYRKVKANMEASQINYREWTVPEMEKFAVKLSELNKKWEFT